jgi:hypothetical protein
MCAVNDVQNAHSGDPPHAVVGNLMGVAKDLFGEQDERLDGGENGERDPNKTKNSYKQLYFYARLETAIDTFNQGQPLSGVAFLDIGYPGRRLYALVLKGCKGMVALRPGPYVCTKNGSAYFSWSLSSQSSDLPFDIPETGWEQQRQSIADNTAFSFLLLPGTHADGRCCYYLVTDEWEEMLPDSSLDLSRIDGVAY